MDEKEIELLRKILSNKEVRVKISQETIRRLIINFESKGIIDSRSLNSLIDSQQILNSYLNGDLDV